jgi:LacI family transcriptional regulator
VAKDSPDRERKKIALLVDTLQVWGRDVYSGVARYAREHTRWSILHQPGSPDRAPEWLGTQHFDGLLGRVKTDEVFERVKRLGCPVINLYTALAGHPFPVIQYDDDAIGAAAAQHLEERGAQHFAFVTGQFLWAKRRLRGFERALLAKGHRVSTFVLPDVPEMATTLGEFDAWLRERPKPVGIFACNDLFGSQVIHAAQGLGLEIPEEVSVIGVDNDLSLCCAAEIELSSIRADPAWLGFRAASLLHGLMRGTSPVSHVPLL